MPPFEKLKCFVDEQEDGGEGENSDKYIASPYGPLRI